jgi:hypothetical protein
LLKVAEAAGDADSGIVKEDVADAGGLLIFDELARVGGEVERRAHVILRAEEADAPAGGDLIAGVGFGEAARRGVGAGDDVQERKLGGGLVGGLGGEGRRKENERADCGGRAAEKRTIIHAQK